MGASTGSQTAYEILRSLRQIVRAVSLQSHKLSSEAGLTVPQLLCLKAIADTEDQEISPSALAKQIQVSPGTVTGITDRLAKLGYLERQRRPGDRRRVYLTLTEAGRKQQSEAPKPLQDRVMERLEALDGAEREEILTALQRVVELMDAGDLDAAPILVADSKLRAPQR